MYKGAGACRGQQRASDHLESELWPDVSSRDLQRQAEGARPPGTEVTYCYSGNTDHSSTKGKKTCFSVPKEKHLFLMVVNTNCPPNFVKKAEPHTNSSKWNIESEADTIP